MALQENIKIVTRTPVTANLINKNRFVNYVTAGEVDEALNAGLAMGVSLQASAAATGEVIPVALLAAGGTVGVEAGGNVTVGTRAMSNATGQAITATGATARVLGTFRESGASGDIVGIDIHSPVDFVA